MDARGPADLVIALALVHHLAIGNNVPLPMFVERLVALGAAAIVEFVPKDDPKVRQLLVSREDVFPNYSEEAFASAFEGAFRVVHRERLPGSSRTLFLGVREA